MYVALDNFTNSSYNFYTLTNLSYDNEIFYNFTNLSPELDTTTLNDNSRVIHIILLTCVGLLVVGIGFWAYCIHKVRG